MDIKEYKYIFEIARQGGVSKAASVLHISQPSLSAYLKNVENRLGAQLFDTSTNPVLPTPVGTVYLEHARQILGIDNALMETLEGIKRRQIGVVRIGITGTRSTYIIPGLMKICREKHPGIDVHVTETNSVNLENMALRQRDLDIIFTNEPFHSDNLSSQLLFREQLLIAVPKCFASHMNPIYSENMAFPWLDIREIKDIPVTLLKPGQRLRQMADALFAECGFSPKVLLETQRVDTALAMAQKGMSTCFLYDSFLTQFHDPELKFFWVGKEPIYLRFVAAYTEEALKFAPVSAVLDTAVSYIRAIQKN